MENYIWRLVQKKNFGHRRGENAFNGNKRQQYYGLLAQAVICLKLGQPVPSFADDFDNGVDFIYNGFAVDVKTTIRNVPYKRSYPANLLDAQYRGKQYKNDYYLFCSFDVKSDALEIIGLIKKSDLEAIGKFCGPESKSFNSAGEAIDVKRARWEIESKDMMPVNSIDDIKKYLTP